MWKYSTGGTSGKTGQFKYPRADAGSVHVLKAEAWEGYSQKDMYNESSSGHGRNRRKKRSWEASAGRERTASESAGEAATDADAGRDMKEPEPEFQSNDEAGGGYDDDESIILKVGGSAGHRHLTLDLHNWQLGDELLRKTLTSKLLRRMQDAIRKRDAEAKWGYVNIDLSSNYLSPEGAKTVLAFFRNSHDTGMPLYIRILKMFKNTIGDEGSKHIAALILIQPQPVHEIHLSHNEITGLGAATIVLALGHMHRYDSYPFPIPQKPEKFAPCWCRLERNQIEEPADLMKAFLRSGDIRVIETTRTTKE